MLSDCIILHPVLVDRRHGGLSRAERLRGETGGISADLRVVINHVSHSENRALFRDATWRGGVERQRYKADLLAEV